MAELPAFTRLKQCRHGLMLYNINDEYIGRSLDLYGEFSEGEVDIFRQIVRPGDIVLEVGANIGAHTVILAKSVGPEGAVVALEPQRLVYQLLCANLALNNLANVWASPAAAGETQGQLRVPELDPRKPTNFGGVHLGEWESGNYVPVLRADDLGLGNCRLIKVDVEGMELEVLKGCRALITNFSPALYVENDRADRSPELVHFIDSLGYAMFWHPAPLFNAQNFLNNPVNVFGAIDSVNMLCIPKNAGDIAGLRRVDLAKPTWEASTNE